MDFTLSEEQAMLRQLVERFAADRYDPSTRPSHRIPDAGRDDSNWALLAEMGLLALPFPAELGGFGGGPIETLVVMEAVGRGLVAEPLLSEIWLGGAILARAGGGARIEAIVAGTSHYALAHSEADAGFALHHVETRVDADGRLSGDKTFVLAGAATDGFIVSARGPDQEIGLYLVAPDAAGLMRRPYRLVDDSTAEELTLAATPAERLAGTFEDLEAVVDEARLAASAEMLGILQTLFDSTLDYARQRRQFGMPIGSFQAIQHRLADLYASLEQARSLVYRAAMTAADERSQAIAAAKSYISAKGLFLAEECVQFHGGMGVTDELIIGHGLKRVLLLANLFGDSDSELRRYLALAA